jgi:hypothetical protein
LEPSPSSSGNAIPTRAPSNNYWRFQLAQFK